MTFQQRKRVEDFPVYSPQLSELDLQRANGYEESYQAYLDAMAEEERRYHMEDLSDFDPSEAPGPFPAMANIGLRRLVFDFGPDRLLLLEGALLVLSVTKPKTWRGVIDVFLDSASDISNGIDTLDAQIRALPDKDDFVECRLVSRGHWLCGRMLSITLIPQDYPRDHLYDYRPSKNGFSWSLEAVELYGNILDVPKELHPGTLKLPFMFDEVSQNEIIRVAASSE